MIRRLKFIFGWPLSILAFIFIGKIVFSNETVVYKNLHDLKIFFFISGIFCFLAYYFFRSYFWQKLLEKKGYRIPLKETAYLWSMSEIKRFIPGSFWSFFGRVNAFSEKEMSKIHITQLLIFEAEYIILGSMVFSLFGIFFIFDQLLPAFAYRNFVVFAVIIIVIVCTFSFLLLSSRQFKYFLPPFKFFQNLSLFFISLVYFFFFGLGTYFKVFSIQVLHPQNILVLPGFFAFSFFVGYISLLTPMGLGVREAVMTAGLAKFISLAAAGFAAIFARIVLIFSELIFLLLAAIWYKSK